MKLCGNYAIQVEILSRIRLKTKYKKKSSPKTEGFLSYKSSEEQKEKGRSSPQFGTIFGPNLGFIRADSHFFV